MDINLESQIVPKTAAQWAADNTVYSAKRILVTSDAYYGSTDQRKFKIADGVQTWSNLDYMPIEQVTTSTIGSAINGAASATPNDTDLVMSVESSVAKKNTWTQIKAFLKTYFDTVYQAAGTYLTSANITQTITNGVTDKAPSEDAVYDALATKTSQMQCSAAIGNLAASNTYYFGINPTLAMSTLTTARVFTFGNTGTINKVVIQITLTGTVASNHSCDVYLRNVTAGTETLLGSITYDQGSNTTTAFTFTPSIAIPNTTDFWTVKIVTGAFTTAPTAVYHNARIFNTN